MNKANLSNQPNLSFTFVKKTNLILKVIINVCVFSESVS